MLIAEALDESAGSATSVNVPSDVTYTGLIADPRLASPLFLSVESIVNGLRGTIYHFPYDQTPASLLVQQYCIYCTPVL